MGLAVLVGTRKGLFVLEGDDERREWTLTGPHLTGFAVYHAIRDPRDGTLYAATNFFEAWMRRCWSTKRVWNWRLPGWLTGPSRADFAPNLKLLHHDFFV